MRNYFRLGNICKLNENILILTICSLIALPTVSYFINISFNYIFISGFIWDTVAINGLVVMFSLISISLVFVNTKKDSLILFWLFLILYLLSFLFYSDNRYYMFTSITDLSQNNFYRLFIYTMPSYFYLRQISDYKLLFTYFSITAKVIVILSIITYVLYIFKGGFELQYMVFAYDSLFGVVFCLYDYFQNSKWFSLLLAVFGSMIIFIGGARGAFVCIVVYMLLYIIFNVINHKVRTLGITTIIAIITVYVSSNLLAIAETIDILLSRLGIKSRTIELIMAQDLYNESGRDYIRSVLIKYIGENTLFGYGMFGDRALTQGISFLDKGTYAHNFVIEVFIQYGVFLGLVFLFTVFFIIIRALMQKQDPIYKDLILLFIPSGLIKLMMSGSYLNEMYFFLLLAASVNAIKHRQNNYI